MHEKLKSLYKQMESELHHLDQSEKQAIKRYMFWAFERGESDVWARLEKGKSIGDVHENSSRH